MPRVPSGVKLTQGGGWIVVPFTNTENTGKAMGCMCMNRVKRRSIIGSILFILNLKVP